MKQLIIGVVIGIFVGTGLYFVLSKSKSTPTTQPPNTQQVDQHDTTKGTHNSSSTIHILGSAEVKKTIEEQATKVLNNIADNNIKSLGVHIHPNKGVRFSQYGRVSKEDDKKFLAHELFAASQAPKTHTWGEQDGTGDIVELSITEYFKNILYKTDYRKLATKIGYNEIIGQGNTINNSREIYPDAIMVEYHYPGSEEFNGMNWSSLSLVFEKENDQWYLVGLINNQWTI